MKELPVKKLPPDKLISLITINLSAFSLKFLISVRKLGSNDGAKPTVQRAEHTCTLGSCRYPMN